MPDGNMDAQGLVMPLTEYLKESLNSVLFRLLKRITVPEQMQQQSLAGLSAEVYKHYMQDSIILIFSPSGNFQFGWRIRQTINWLKRNMNSWLKISKL